MFKIHDPRIKWKNNFIYLWSIQNVSKLMCRINEEILTEVWNFKFSVEILRTFYIKNVNVSYPNQIWNKVCFCFYVPKIARVWDILWNHVHGKLNLSHQRKFAHKISVSVFILLKFLVEIFYLKKINFFFFPFEVTLINTIYNY